LTEPETQQPAPEHNTTPRSGLRLGTILRLIFQLGGFLVGLALLGWCVQRALSPENRGQFALLRDASPSLVAAMMGLTALSIMLNGLVFWAVVRPVRRLKPPDMIAVNALATFLNFLPFKLSVIFRVLIHNRRDGLPVFVIGSWFAAMGAVLIAGIGPLVIATVISRSMDARWFAAAAISLVGAMASLVILGRIFGGQAGLSRSFAIVDSLRLRPLSTLVRAGFIRDLHAGMDMLASPRALALSVGLRLTDAMVQALRFSIAAQILGRPLDFDQALMFSVTYFAIGILSPVGMLGFRESGTAAVAQFVGIPDPEGFVVVPLLVGGTEVVVIMVFAGLAIAWLRPLKWILPGSRPPAPPTSQA
jgi:hypothetical protein